MILYHEHSDDISFTSVFLVEMDLSNFYNVESNYRQDDEYMICDDDFGWTQTKLAPTALGKWS